MPFPVPIFPKKAIQKIGTTVLIFELGKERQEQDWNMDQTRHIDQKGSLMEISWRRR